MQKIFTFTHFYGIFIKKASKIKYMIISNRNSKFIIQSKITQDLFNFINRKIKPIFKIEKINCGLVHTVYKIYSTETYYIKIRGTSFAKIPSLVIDPNDIKYEKKAIKIFSKILPNIFPTVIDFDKNLSALIITDTIINGATLHKLFQNNKVDKYIIRNIGEAIGKTHLALNDAEMSIYPNKDRDKYRKNFDNRLLTFTYPPANAQVDRLIKKLSKLPKKLILADLSPKNIGVSEDKRISFFDLECAHLGNQIFDLGFFLGHIILHSKNDSNLFIKNFLLGYSKYIKNTIDRETLNNVIGLTMLYRLHNKTIPYPLFISNFERKKLTNQACSLLG